MKKFLLAGALAVLGWTGVMADDTLALDLPFSDATGIVDQSQYKNKVLLNGNAVQKDNALQLSSKRANANAGINNILGIGDGSITVIASFKLTGTQGERSALVSRGAGSAASPGYAFMYRAPKKALYLYLSDGKKRYSFQSNNDDLNDGKWHTVAFSFNRSGEVIFALDGRIRGTREVSGFSDGDINDKSIDLQIGTWCNSFSLNGAIKNVKIYKIAHGARQLSDETKQK